MGPWTISAGASPVEAFAASGLEALAYVDTAGLEHARPGDGDRRLDAGRRVIRGLVADEPAEPFLGRLKRLLGEIDFRRSWADVRREEA